jgi:flagellar basal body-associated protein FliL
MSASPAPDQPSSRDGALPLAFAAAALLLGLGAWAYTSFGAHSSEPSRPVPAWLTISKVMAQMSDGRMVKIKVDLRVQDKDAVGTLKPQTAAFTALIEEVGGHMSREDLQGSEGMARLGSAIQTALNDYLQEQRVPERVKGVAFEELTLLPESALE